MIRLGVIGYGYWGPNLVRNFSECPATQVVAVADLNDDRLSLVNCRYPGIEITKDYNDLLRNPDVDAVAISTPVASHFKLALEALHAGKHVLVEKPMTVTSEQALRLIDEADRRNLVLMVDHTFVYTGAVRKIRDLIGRGTLGEVYYYDSTRVNLGLFQHDIDVIWDLAVHDLSIMEFVLPEFPVAVSATGLGHVKGIAENVAYVTAFYDSPLIAHLNVNWLSPVKVRKTLIGGSRQMIVYDDTVNSEKVKVYDRGITVKNGPESLYKSLVSYRSGDMYCPQIEMTEALRVEAEHFAECIEEGKTPVTDGFAGLRVVSVLEAATQSMKDRGRSVLLNSHAVPRPVCVA
ncbi:MAG TPA: Gfo/Idh/MocA family oxidoreductase [Bryobacteraceae bacterium]|nr:Gfo/Idh/MocA family oxidoreductase [Bryobacteraceae bacterium]